MPKVGDTVKGKVVRVEHHGAYLDADGLEVLVLITEVTWRPPATLPQVGQTLEVKLIRKTPTLFSGSLRRLDREGNPYLPLLREPADSVHQATVDVVVGSQPFVKLENGASGRVNGIDPEGVRIGDVIRVKIAAVDPEEGRAEFELWRPTPSP